LIAPIEEIAHPNQGKGKDEEIEENEREAHSKEASIKNNTLAKDKSEGVADFIVKATRD
jgi:hypothetical protein